MRASEGVLVASIDIVYVCSMSRVASLYLISLAGLLQHLSIIYQSDRTVRSICISSTSLGAILSSTSLGASLSRLHPLYRVHLSVILLSLSLDLYRVAER